MNQIDFPRGIQEHISTQQVGQELLVYDETRHKAFCLNGTSAAVWQMCDGMHNVEQIASAVTLQLAAPVREEIVLFALAELRADGLLEPAPLPAPLPALSRRQLMRKLGAGAAMLLPAVAAVMAPKAAEAYSGCLDCDVSSPRRALRRPPIVPVAPIAPVNSPE
jgi:Coenzyme PQQ synthesis protein D (PqqD)